MEQRRLTFPRSHRLKRPAEFAAVYAARARQATGPLLIYAGPNNLGHWRLGLSVSRKVGTAPRRNRIKRLLREAFRTSRHELPVGCDWVIVVRPHEPLSLSAYREIIAAATWKLKDVVNGDKSMREDVKAT
jgi:ribonuclease P protein component